MRGWLLTLFLILAATSAQADATKIECTKSMLRFAPPGNYTCYDMGGSMSTNNLVLTRSAAVVGSTTENVRLSLYAARISSGDGYFRNWTVSKSAEPDIRAFNGLTKAATNWGEMRALD